MKSTRKLAQNLRWQTTTFVSCQKVEKKTTYAPEIEEQVSRSEAHWLEYHRMESDVIQNLMVRGFQVFLETSGKEALKTKTKLSTQLSNFKFGKRKKISLSYLKLFLLFFSRSIILKPFILCQLFYCSYGKMFNPFLTK